MRASSASTPKRSGARRPSPRVPPAAPDDGQSRASRFISKDQNVLSQPTAFQYLIVLPEKITPGVLRRTRLRELCATTHEETT